MGLFSRKPKPIEYDPAEAQRLKERMRTIFNQEVEDGDTYKLIHATSQTSKYEKGIYFDKTTTTFYYYIVGYRSRDYQIVLIQIDREMEQHTEPFYMDMNLVVDMEYYKSNKQVALIYPKGSEAGYGEILTVNDNPHTSVYGIPDLYQAEEREDFLDFLEKFRATLEMKGYKLRKWKR